MSPPLSREPRVAPIPDTTRYSSHDNSSSKKTHLLLLLFVSVVIIIVVVVAAILMVFLFQNLLDLNFFLTAKNLNK